VSAILLGAAALIFSYYLTPPFWPKLMGGFDWYRYFGPQAYFLDASLDRGQFPLWNPLAFCGTPYAANPQVTIFYPPHLLRSILNFAPSAHSTLVSIWFLLAFHVVVAGLGTYALARDYGLSRPAAVVAAIVYAFGPHFVRRILEQWILVAVAAWVPVLLFLLRRAMLAPDRRGKLYYACLSGLVFGLNILAGFPQLTFYTGILVAAFVLLERILHLRLRRQEDAGGPSRLRSLFRCIFHDAAVLALLGIIAMFSAMAMLLPAAEFAELSARHRGGGFEVEAAKQDLSFGHLLKCMAVYPGATWSEQGCRGAGIVALVLAVLALAHVRRRDVFLYALLFYVMTDATIGPPWPIGRMVAAVDVLQFSSPWRAGILAGLPLALLAGFGIDTVTDATKRARSWPLWAGLAFVLGIVLLILLSEWQRSAPFIPASPYVVYIPVVGLALIVAGSASSWPSLSCVLLATVVVAEIFAWNQTFVPAFATARGYTSGPKYLESPGRLSTENVRAIDPYPNLGYFSLTRAMNGYDPLYLGPVREFLSAPERGNHYFRNIRGWEPTSRNTRGLLYLKRPFWLTKQYVQGPAPGKDALFPSTTTVFLPESPGNIPIPEVVAGSLPPSSVSEAAVKRDIISASELGRVAGNLRGSKKKGFTLPPFSLGTRHAALRLRYRCSDTAELFAIFRDTATGAAIEGAKQILRRTGSGSAECEITLPDYASVSTRFTCMMRSTTTEIEFLEAYVLEDPADENHLIEIIDYEPNAVNLWLRELPGSRILLFTDAAYPGWRALLDGAPVPILRANDIFKAVVVPSGTHQVRFEFRPWTVTVGVILSLLTLLAVAVVCLWTYPRQRAKSTSDAPVASLDLP